ncbi:MAG: 50S ribosomal protein L10 [Bacteroidales bacterium]|nr:50S ribosomal protein L10 [Bacteroidales bacterium]
MTRQEKDQVIDNLTEQLKEATHWYVTDTSELNVEVTNKLRGMCHKRNIKMMVVKNTLLRKAMERAEQDYGELYEALKGPTAIMFSETGNEPAKLIKEFRKTSNKPILKGAFIEEMAYLGDDQLDNLVKIKSKNELIADVIASLQSPAQNVISALQSGGGNLAGILKTLSEKEEK